MKKYISIILFSLCGAATAYSACPDFTDIEAPNVEAFTGRTWYPFDVQGIVHGRHTVISAQGTDPNTGGALALLPPGESKVVRLGNQQVGAEAEALSYRFIVDKYNPVLLVKFAVVFQDPNHPSIYQPRFVIRITDKEGNLTEECAEYDVSARVDIPGFQSYQGSIYTPVRWRDWTNVGLDMSPYIGQEVQVQFITYDCGAGAHFGYAYFTASCISNTLQLDGCTNTEFTLEAPENFESYLWSNGATTRTTTFNIAASENSSLTCVVTSATGCRFTLYAYVTTDAGITSGSYKDIICEGETYNKYHFNLPPQEVGTHFYQNVIVNPATCKDDQVIDLELTAVERYNHIKAAICHGEDYEENGFNIIQPAAGVRRDTLEMGTVSGCVYYNVLELTVNTNLNMPDLIQGDFSPCSGELATYSFAGAETLTRFEWILPDNAKFYKSNKFSQQITLYYTGDTPSVLSLSGQNGCGSAVIDMPVHPRQTHHISLPEAVCQGTDFRKYNFNLGVQDSVGYFVYEKRLQSSQGCDSTVTLGLNVLPVPVVRIEPAPAVLCNPGEEITLWAVTDLIPCVDYEEWYNSLTPADESDFYIMGFGPHALDSCNIAAYQGAGGRVVIPSKINGNTVWIVAVYSLLDGLFDNVTEIILPPTVETIGCADGCGAIADNNLRYITIPKNVLGIMPNAFANSPNLTIRCYENSYAHQYAIDNNIKFELMEDCSNDGNDGDDGDGVDIIIYDCDLDYLWSTGSTEGFITVKPDVTTEYSVIVTTQSGCSATAKQTVVVNANAPQTIYETICEGEVYEKYGLNETTTGVYPVTITEEDCSFTLNVDLTVNPAYHGKIVDVVCAGEHYHKHGLDFTLIQEGVFIDTLRFLRSTGCDSIVALEITVLPARETLLRDSICQYSHYKKHGFDTIPEIPGIMTLTQTLASAADCDSTVTLRLFVKPVNHNIISDETEQNSAYNRYNFNLPNVTKDTVVVRNLTSELGCDSTVTLNLKVNSTSQPPCEVYRDTILHSMCEGENYDFNGKILNESGTYSDTIKSISVDCDSIITTLHLTVNPIVSTTINDEVNQNDTYNRYNFNLPNVTQDTVVVRNLTSELGCDSTVTLNLKVNIISNPPCFVYGETIRHAMCEGESYDFNGNILYESGTYSDTIPSISADCDSIITLRLTVNPDYYNVISDEVNQNDTYNRYNFNLPNVSRDTVVIRDFTTVFGCDSTVTLLLTVRITIPKPDDTVTEEMIIPNIITPHDRNGFNDTFMTPRGDRPGYKVEIYNRYSQKVYEGENGWDGTYRGKLAEPGTYYYRLFMKDGTILKGTVEVAKL